MKNSYRINFTQFLLSTLLATLLVSFYSSATEVDTVLVSDGLIRETIPGTSISSAYMTIANQSNQATTLVGVSSKVSPRIEIHQHTMIDGMMRMGQVEDILIAPHSAVALQPSGLHLMIFELEKPLVENSSVELILLFSNNTNLAVTLPVISIKNTTKQHKHK